MDASPETGIDLKAMTVRSEAWMLNNNSSIEADSIWRNIRRDWLEDLESPEASTLHDLETMYTQMVNVEGVTTSFSESLIGTTSTSKHLLTLSLLTKSAKPRHRNFSFPFSSEKHLGRRPQATASTFKDPTQRRREEVQADEIEDDRFLRGGELERMVTSALFAEYFREAHESLKVTLLKQYRMHRDIMRSTNEFYEGKLECGLSDEDQQERLKQHGFHLRKKDSGGTFIPRVLTFTPNQHLVWVDSTFDRDGKYCKKLTETTYSVEMSEVHLAKYMLDEFEEQIAARKQEISQAEWQNDTMLATSTTRDAYPLVSSHFTRREASLQRDCKRGRFMGFHAKPLAELERTGRHSG